jgi:hypothetical protein
VRYEDRKQQQLSIAVAKSKPLTMTIKLLMAIP